MEGNLPDNAILVSIDVSALYTNIPQTEGMEDVREAFDERKHPDVPTEFILKLLELILKFNIFEFNSELFLQLIGTAMGTKPAPSYANIFMARKIDIAIEELAAKFGDGIYPIRLLKRFLYDIFMIFTGSIENLHLFLEELNAIHPTIQCGKPCSPLPVFPTPDTCLPRYSVFN